MIILSIQKCLTYIEKLDVVPPVQSKKSSQPPSLSLSNMDRELLVVLSGVSCSIAFISLIAECDTPLKHKTKLLIIMVPQPIILLLVTS